MSGFEGAFCYKASAELPVKVDNKNVPIEEGQVKEVSRES
jgi:hypothetical protein